MTQCKCFETWDEGVMLPAICDEYLPDGGMKGVDGLDICIECGHDFSCHATYSLEATPSALAEAAKVIDSLLALLSWPRNEGYYDEDQLIRMDEAESFARRIEATNGATENHAHIPARI